MGCSPAAGCDTTTSDRVGGNVVASGALALILHSDTINGMVSLQGGGGGVDCIPNAALSAALGAPVPLYSMMEDDTIGGGLTASGYQSCWLGVIHDQISGGAVVNNNTLADPDAIEVATNTVDGNLVCTGNVPATQIGDSGGAKSTVSGRKIGQCAAL